MRGKCIHWQGFFWRKRPFGGELVIAQPPRSPLYANEGLWTTPITMPGRQAQNSCTGKKKKKDCKLFTVPRRIGFTMEREKGDSTWFAGWAAGERGAEAAPPNRKGIPAIGNFVKAAEYYRSLWLLYAEDKHATA